jgi:hypothetical protein
MRPIGKRRAVLRNVAAACRYELSGSRTNHDAFDREYFAGLSPGERMTLVGKMLAEQWLLMGGNEDELRLRRDIARVQRRGR